MPKPAIDPAIRAHFEDKAAHASTKLAKSLTAEHTRRVKNVFTSHIADAAVNADKARINELKALQRDLITALQGSE